MNVGVGAVGTYLPPGRLQVKELRQHWPGVASPGGVTSVSVAGYDEDIVTMGVEAAQAALSGTELTFSSVDLLIVATCSSPYVEHSAAAEIARAIALEPTTALVDLAGSTLGAVNGVAMARSAVLAGSATRALVVATDRRRGMPGSAVEALGAGAVALLISEDAPSTLGPSVSFRHGVPTRWRSEDSAVLRNYDDARYELVGQVEPAVKAVLDALTGSPTQLALGPLDVRSRTSIQRSVKLANEGASFDGSTSGDMGTAGALFELAGLLEGRVGGAVACIAVEPGTGATGFTLTIDAQVPVTVHQPDVVPVSYVEYLQRFGVLEGPKPPSPIVPWAATPGAWRSDLEGSLVGVRCTACHSLNIPPRHVCIDCGATVLTPEQAPRLGEVVTFNVQHMVAVHPEPSPVAVGVIRLRGETGERGGQVSAMFCDSNLHELHIGQTVELVYRRLGIDDGLVKYGWKVRTVTPTDALADHGSSAHVGKGSS
jgi:hydroxymethylglutaryl-CoA synthase